ncbi:MAG: ABC transporter permease subunit [Burkholderiales bacterium]
MTPAPARSGLALQAGLLLVLVAAGYAAATIASANLARAGIGIDFGFFFQQAGFDIGDPLIAFGASDTYARAFVVGLLNTLVLAVVAGALATLVGVAVAIVLVSGNPLAEWVARAYVEAMRNLPKLVLLLVVYVVMVAGLPSVRASLHPLPGVFLSNRGLYLPAPDWDTGALVRLAAMAGAALAGALLAFSWRRARRDAARPWLPIAAGLLAAGAVAVLFPPAWTVPELAGFDFAGGAFVALPFIALVFTLTVYHGAQIAEVLRGGINAVPAGQWHAALALGLTPWQRMASVILPQVVRSVLPPMTNQYLNLLKNTSIGLAVGYTELMAVAGTTINQSLRSVEVMTVVMSVYLAIGLAIAIGMNHLNARLRLGLA